MERRSVDLPSVLEMAMTIHQDLAVPHEVRFLVVRSIQVIAATVATNVGTTRTIVTSSSPPPPLDGTDLIQDLAHALVTTDAGAPVAVKAAVAPESVGAVVVALESTEEEGQTFLHTSVCQAWSVDVMITSC